MTKSLTYGFTLIEILISMTILVILMGLMTLAFHTVIEKQKLIKEVTLITTELEKARDSAFFGKKPIDPNCLILTGVQVTIDTQVTNPNLRIVTVCNDTDQYNEKIVPLDPEIEITTDVNQIQFAAVSQTTNLTESMEIQVEAKNGAVEVIQISPAGKIGIQI